MCRGLATKLVLRCLAAGLAVVAFFVLALSTAAAWGLALMVAATAAGWAERRVRPKAELVAELVLLAAGVLVAYARQRPDFDWALVPVGVAMLGLILAEGPLREASGLEISTANLDVRLLSRMVAARLPEAIPLLLAAVAASAALAVPPWPVMVLTAVVAAAGAVAALALARRRLRPSGAPSPVARALRRHQPRFVLYFSAPPRSEYQVLMWLPYLERIGAPFIVVLREPESLPVISGATRVPVVVCPTLHALDEVIGPSVRAVFYVNHSANNNHCVRFAHLTHVQLHHGDSDKSPSANPASAIYDKIFVAGQAAIDRYARNGVDIPRDKFVIVGRPQVESIDVTGRRIGDLAERVVLYTPTWTGHYADANYCSLPIGEALVEHLLARGVTVILRAHPYTSHNPESLRQLARIEDLLSSDRARTGRQHVWGAPATKRMSLTECANRSHALISDVSGVISDYLFSGKPYAVTDMLAADDRFTTDFPLVKAGYVLRRDMSNVDETLDLLLDHDPLAQMRRAVRVEYLGDFPAESYAEAFLAEARRCLEATEPPSATTAAADAVGALAEVAAAPAAESTCAVPVQPPAQRPADAPALDYGGQAAFSGRPAGARRRAG